MYAVSIILEELIISDLYVFACAALWTLKNSSGEVLCEFFNCAIAQLFFLGYTPIPLKEVLWR